ncbi:MAG: gluconate 2-dehydrogenase subunit 3 family protein [Alphaproteobacteria bacterium]|nr:gluconate 2-dehydrogenase subunit 3 family protein [Alphaproteobacteria bacterium]
MANRKPTVLNRRSLLTGAFAVSALGGAALARSPQPPDFDPGNRFRPDEADAPAPVTGERYVFFSQEEAALMAALLDRIIPADDLGPGADEAGVTFFLDRQLSGGFGAGQSYYMQGPWSSGTKQQGYQTRLTPAQLYRTAIAGIEKHAQAHYGKSFADLDASQQDAIVTALEHHDVDLNGAPRDQFFSLLLTNASEGYFADPLYGGNRNMAGWKMLGFPGAHYDYRPYVAQHNKRLSIPPAGIYGGPAWENGK